MYVTPGRHGRKFNSAEFHPGPVWQLRAKSIRLEACGHLNRLRLASTFSHRHGGSHRGDTGRQIGPAGRIQLSTTAAAQGSDGNCGGAAQLDTDGDSTLIVARRSPAIGSHEAATPDDVIGGVLALVSRAWRSATVS